MNVRNLTLLVTLIFFGFNISAFAGKPNKPGGGGNTAKYTAELTAGDFVFASGTISGLTAEKKGTSLTGDFKLEMIPESAFAWNYIFLPDCSALLPDGISGFGVPAGQWWVNYTRSKRSPGNIHITMRDLVVYPGTSSSYSGVDFDLDLHGEVVSGIPFLPANLGQTSTHKLTVYKLWAGANGPGGFTCNSDGQPSLDTPSTLVIKRIN